MNKPRPHVITIPADAALYSDAQQCAAWLSRAEGAVKMPHVGANAIAFYKADMARCLACQAGARCERHGTDALRPPETFAGPDNKDVRRVIAIYVACFAEARGARPTFRDREALTVQKLILDIGAQKTEEAIRAAFAAGSYWRDKATILTIAADPSKHLGNGKAARGTLQADSGFESRGKEIA